MNTISTIVRIKLASFICVAPALFSAPALAQKMIPVPAPTGVSNTSTPPLPAPLTRDEQRFRELASYIKSRGSIDAQTRADIVKLAVDIDKDLTAATTDRDQMLRLLPARAQISIWLDDSAAMDSAFERLLAVTTAPDAVVLAWARELNASSPPMQKTSTPRSPSPMRSSPPTASRPRKPRSTPRPHSAAPLIK